MAWTAPKTWNSGDIFTYIDANAYLRDNLTYLSDNGLWTLLTPTAAFSVGGVFNQGLFGYLLVGDWVIVRGGCNTVANTGSLSATCATLPVGARPGDARLHVFPVMYSVGLGLQVYPGRVDIQAGGAITFNPESLTGSFAGAAQNFWGLLIPSLQFTSTS